MPARSEPRQNQESPIRIFGMDGSGRAVNVSAWTVDVSRHGARVRGVSDWSQPGETIGVRCGMEKARYKIMWVGQDGTPHQGQIGLLCVEAGKYIWGVAAPQAAGAAAVAPGKMTGMFRLPDEARAPIGLAPSPPPVQRATPAGNTAPVANNRRKDARYKASGGAKVQEIGAAAAQWATLHDLSLGGCYVETTAPLPPTSVVNMTIHINDISIAARGSVTVCHKLVGMGVRFTEVSPLNRTRLEQVMATLMQTSSEA